MKPLSDCVLYTFIDTACLHGRAPEEIAKQLCAGGSDIIQLRAKNWPEDQIARVAESVKPILDAAGVHLVINDYPRIAQAVGASLCHLGQEDFFDAGRRHGSALKPPGAALGLGLSTHSPEQAQRALAAEPDYIAIGPVFATPTKPTAVPVTLDYVRWAAAHVTIPWFAIGGITLETLPRVLEAGATRICVVSAILNAPDLVGACRQFRQPLGS